MVYSEDRSTHKEPSSGAVTSSPGHTPGPWDFEADEASSGKMFTVYDQHGIRLTDPYIGEREARLIAAAPDLLDALTEVVAISDRDHEAWDRAKAAIAKARSLPAI